VIGDALDREGLRAAVVAARPDQVLHLLTAIPPVILRPRHLEATNHLRIAGTANLIEAAVAAGARRIVAESFVSVYGKARFDHPVTEDEPLPPVGRGALHDSVAALRTMEEQLRATRDEGRIDTVSLRFGFLYGADVPSTRDFVEQARAGKLAAPVLPGLAANLHIDDASSAILAAIERPRVSPVYNVVDDEPMPIQENLTLLARAIGARPPRLLPGWLVRLAAPVVAELGSLRLVLSNVKARRELGWTLRYPNAREGLAELSRALEEAA
jgi:nucleoside-diphosphate-sugar epimerase